MFPNLDLESIAEQINNEVTQENSTEIGRVFLMQFNGNKATVIMENGKPKEATTKEKVQMYTQMLLRTKLDKYKVYKNEDFGMTYFNYMGMRNLPQNFINIEFKRELEEKLKQLNIVDSITNFSANKQGSVLYVEFTINLINGESIEISEVI
ncbi:MAG: DUF2634 domain-containing protein [Firmicutes bacterium]|nr:DUF2634 domain-containing protein [Bacillota bacterium]